MNLDFRRLSPIGVDLAGRWLRAAQTSSGRGGVRLEAWARVRRRTEGALPSPEEVLDLAGVIERGGFEPAPLVIAAPREVVLGSVLELPPRSSGAPLDQIARLEVARAARCSPDSLQLGMWDVPPPARGGDATHAAVAAIPRDQAGAIASMFDAANLDILRIDVRSRALARATSTVQPPAGLLALLDVGWLSSAMILVLGGVPVFERSMDVLSLARLCRTAGERLRVDPAAVEVALAGDAGDHAKPLLREVRSIAGEAVEQACVELARSASFIAHRYPGAPIRRLALAGEGAPLPGLRERAGEVLGGVDAVLFAPAHRVRTPHPTPAQDSGLVAAVGLTLGDTPVALGEAS